MDRESFNNASVSNKIIKKNEEERYTNETLNDDEEGGVITPGELIFNPDSKTRNWLKKHGKKHCIDFDDEELRKLR